MSHELLQGAPMAQEVKLADFFPSILNDHSMAACGF